MISPATPPPVRRNAAILAVVLVRVGPGGAALVGPPVPREPPASDEVERPERLASPLTTARRLTPREWPFGRRGSRPYVPSSRLSLVTPSDRRVTGV